MLIILLELCRSWWYCLLGNLNITYHCLFVRKKFSKCLMQRTQMYLNSPQKVFIISWSTLWHILHGFGSYTYFKSTYISIYMNLPATSHIQYTFYNAVAIFGKKLFPRWCWLREAKSGNHGKHACTFVSPHLFGSFDLRNLNPNINGEIGLHTKSNFNSLWPHFSFLGVSLWNH